MGIVDELQHFINFFEEIIISLFFFIVSLLLGGS